MSTEYQSNDYGKVFIVLKYSYTVNPLLSTHSCSTDGPRWRLHVGYSCVSVSAVNHLSSPLDGRSTLSPSLSSYRWAGVGWLPNRRRTAWWCCGRVAWRMGIETRAGRACGRTQTLKQIQTVIDIQQLLHNHLLRRPATTNQPTGDILR